MTSCCASLKLRQTCPMSGQILNAICTPEVPHRIQLKLEFCLKLYCCLASFLFPVLLPPSFSPEGTFIINDLNIEPLHRLCCSEPGPSQHGLPWSPWVSLWDFHTWGWEVGSLSGWAWSWPTGSWEDNPERLQSPPPCDLEASQKLPRCAWDRSCGSDSLFHPCHLHKENLN